MVAAAAALWPTTVTEGAEVAEAVSAPRAAGSPRCGRIHQLVQPPPCDALGILSSISQARRQRPPEGKQLIYAHVWVYGHSGGWGVGQVFQELPSKLFVPLLV